MVSGLLLGVALRVAYVNRPFDHRNISSWHQADYVQVARNFHLEGANLFYPQIDWRGDTPGYVEMELPLIPWIGALLFRWTGYSEALLRGLSVLLSLVALFIFLLLCRERLPPWAGLFALTAFAVNPLLVHLATAIQPESLMLLLSMLAAIMALRWMERPRLSTLMWAALFAGMATLAKAPAAYLGLLLVYIVIRRRGFRAVVDPGIVAAGLVALLPPVAWYVWARGFWTEYGLSLGVSNESHLLFWQMLFPPRFLIEIVKWETLGVFTPAGWILAIGAALWARSRAEGILAWYASILVFFLLTGYTSGASWAFYYHSAAVAPACLLMGVSLAKLSGSEAPKGLSRFSGWQRAALACLVAGAVLIAEVGALAYLIRYRDGHAEDRELRACVLGLAGQIPADERIMTRGISSRDRYGLPIAYNDPLIFAWMDRKGFSYPREQLSREMLEDLAQRGGRYWIAHPEELDPGRSGFEPDRHYRQVGACENGYRLYDLNSSPGPVPG